MKTGLRHLLSALMISAGVLHFARPDGFAAIVPAYLPHPYALVYLSGFFEIAGGLGLFPRATRSAAAFGLILLFIAVFPANLNMALHRATLASRLPLAVVWGRLPLQLVLVAWAYWYTRREPGQSTAGSFVASGRD